ncbi:hypothetical protein HBZS_118330 [Helicobacter bizzozeronii CCUG 35545]|nr:hypothetical protein HBZS_118330 [Helicobacter bizzozeronii CCUG 35545]
MLNIRTAFFAKLLSLPSVFFAKIFLITNRHILQKLFAIFCKNF